MFHYMDIKVREFLGNFDRHKSAVLNEPIILNEADQGCAAVLVSATLYARLLDGIRFSGSVGGIPPEAITALVMTNYTHLD